MSTLLTVLQVVIALLLISVVLIQEPKSTGGGLFSGTGQSLLGTSGKGFWTKFTTGLAVVFFLICLGIAALPKYRQPNSSVADDLLKQQQQSSMPPAAAPGGSSTAAKQPSSQAAPAPAAAPKVPAPASAPGSKKP